MKQEKKKWLKMYSSFKTKAEAQKYAKECRELGYPTRVKKSNDPYDIYPYHIYTQDK